MVKAEKGDDKNPILDISLVYYYFFDVLRFSTFDAEEMDSLEDCLDEKDEEFRGCYQFTIEVLDYP